MNQSEIRVVLRIYLYEISTYPRGSVNGHILIVNVKPEVLSTFSRE